MSDTTCIFYSDYVGILVVQRIPRFSWYEVVAILAVYSPLMSIYDEEICLIYFVAPEVSGKLSTDELLEKLPFFAGLTRGPY